MSKTTKVIIAVIAAACAVAAAVAAIIVFREQLTEFFKGMYERVRRESEFADYADVDPIAEVTDEAV